MSASEERETSDPDWSKSYRETKDVPWYRSNIDEKVTTETRRLLEQYSDIPPSQVLQHVHTIRDKAWAIRSYPCTGLGLWLDPMLPKSPAYPSIIHKLQSGASFLDIGCFIGQDIRRLVADGAPSERLYAVDVVSHWDLGFEMYRDRDRFSAHFIEADIMYPTAELSALRGTVDVISITHVLHQWDWADQVKAVKRLVELSSGKEALVIGFQIGSAGVREKEASGLAKSASYWHDEESFERMWDQAGGETGTRWVCETRMLGWEEVGWDPKDTEYLGVDARVIEFVVRRVS